MLDGYFSKRHKLTSQSRGINNEFIPEPARTSLCQILDNYFQEGSLNTNQLYFNICHALNIHLENSHGKLANIHRDTHEAINNLVSTCEWWQFYDICEVIPRSLNPCFYYNVKQDFYEKMNILFRTEKMSFRINDNGIVEKADTSFMDATISRIRYLLQEPEFQESGRLFEDILYQIYTEGQQDYKNCIKMTVSLIEAILGRLENAGGEIPLSTEKANGATGEVTIPQPVKRAIRNIYLSLGEYQRESNGISGSPEIGINEAEFALAITASIATYLANKEHHSVNTNPQNQMQTLLRNQRSIRN